MGQTTDGIRDYPKAISRHRRLKPEEEVKLGKAVQSRNACLEVKQRLSKDGQEISKEQWATEVGCSEAELARILSSLHLI